MVIGFPIASNGGWFKNDSIISGSSVIFSCLQHEKNKEQFFAFPSHQEGSSLRTAAYGMRSFSPVDPTDPPWHPSNKDYLAAIVFTANAIDELIRTNVHLLTSENASPSACLPPLDNNGRGTPFAPLPQHHTLSHHVREELRSSVLVIPPQPFPVSPSAPFMASRYSFAATALSHPLDREKMP
eukprot:15198609-Ditylum_brightwellii.AAC.1